MSASKGRRQFAGAVLVVMLALIVIGIATGTDKLTELAVVVGALPAFASGSSRFRSSRQGESPRPSDDI